GSRHDACIVSPCREGRTVWRTGRRRGGGSLSQRARRDGTGDRLPRADTLSGLFLHRLRSRRRAGRGLVPEISRAAGASKAWPHRAAGAAMIPRQLIRRIAGTAGTCLALMAAPPAVRSAWDLQEGVAARDVKVFSEAVQCYARIITPTGCAGHSKAPAGVPRPV